MIMINVRELRVGEVVKVRDGSLLLCTSRSDKSWSILNLRSRVRSSLSAIALQSMQPIKLNVGVIL